MLTQADIAREMLLAAALQLAASRIEITVSVRGPDDAARLEMAYDQLDRAVKEYAYERFGFE